MLCLIISKEIQKKIFHYDMIVNVIDHKCLHYLKVDNFPDKKLSFLDIRTKYKISESEQK